MMVLNMIMIMNCSQDNPLHKERKTRHQVMVMHHASWHHVLTSSRPQYDDDCDVSFSTASFFHQMP